MVHGLWRVIAATCAIPRHSRSARRGQIGRSMQYSAKNNGVHEKLPILRSVTEYAYGCMK